MPVIASCVVVKDDRVLMVQEGDKSSYGKWNIPSGGVDANEPIVVAAAREVFEETGCVVVITALTGVYDFTSETGNHLLRFNFVGELVDDGRSAFVPDILAVKWMTLKEIRPRMIRRYGTQSAYAGSSRTFVQVGDSRST